MDIVTWLIEGVPFGCVYALVAVGLVLTYKTTGVFNLAFSAQALVAGAVYVIFIEEKGWSRFPAFILAVFVVSPLLGLVLDRALFRYIRTASWQAKLVSSLGLFIAIPEMVRIVFLEDRKPEPATLATQLPPMFGIDDAVWQTGDYFVGWDYTLVTIITVAVVLGLGFIFRYTATGLHMRAVVESPRMVELAGVDSERVSAISWMLSSTLAGLAGVLLAPLAGTLDPNIYSILTVSCIAAAVVGRLQSIPWAFAGGVLLGVGERAMPDLLDEVGVDSSDPLSQNIRPTLPFIVLFLVLVLSRVIQRRREAADPLAGVDPPPPAMAHTYKNAELARTTKIIFPIFIIGFLAVMMTLVSDIWVFRITDGFTLAIVFLSITVFTGFGGQISLAQSTFAGVGGFAGANLAIDHGVPIEAGIVIGALLAAAVGAALALPALRLGGIYLTLATLAFALMVENVIFSRADVSNTTFGLEVPRPDYAQGDKTFFLFVFGIFAVVGFGVILVRKGTIGRFFAAIRGSETAAASIGINAMKQRILLFALSAGIAGVGGGLIAMFAEDVRTGESPTFPAIIGVAWVVLVVTLGSRTVDGAVNAGLSFVIAPWFLSVLGFPDGIFVILFGLGAITYARHPEGIVEFRTRVSIQAQIRGRALNARAKAARAAGTLPKTFTPVGATVLPALAGPLAYLLYVLGRSAIDGDWVTAHTTTLLCFLLPSVAYLLAWMLRADGILRRAGGRTIGPIVFVTAAGAGALVGAFLLPEIGFDLPGSTLDRALIGLPAGAAAAMFVWLPMQGEAVARAKGWLDMPITWRDGRTQVFFVLFGTWVFHNMTTESPPNGWPVFVFAAICTIVWVNWLATMQGAMNELAIGSEGEARRMADAQEAPPPATTATPVGAPAGGAE